MSNKMIRTVMSTRTLRLVALLWLLPALAFGAPSSQMNLAAIAQTEIVNVRTYGVVCDGSTDDYTAFTAAIAATPSGGRLYVPPSATACLFSQELIISNPITLFATPGTVTLKVKTGNTTQPLLLNVLNNTGPVTIYGITFDGGGTAFASSNNVLSEFQSSNVTWDHITVQNTRGVGMNISTSSVTGVVNSQFTNIGMFWQTSGLPGDRHQAIAYCCATSAKNFVLNNYFHNIGLDSISMTNQNDYLVEGNRCDLALGTPQWVTLTAGPWAACIYVDNNNAGVIVGNMSDSASGNAIDVGNLNGHGNLTVAGNYAINTGGAGIAISSTSQFTVVGNVSMNGGQNSTDCHIGGISFANTNVTGTVAGNTVTDSQGTKTQQYGIYSFTACSNAATMTNVYLDPSNQLIGNKTAAFGGGLSKSVLGSQTIDENLTLAPSGAAPALTLTPAAGQFGELINSAGSSDGMQIFAASAQTASMKLRGNGNSGANGLLLSQDASSIVHLANGGNAAISLDTNGSSRLSISGAGVSSFTSAIASTGSTFSAAGTGACATTTALTGGAVAGSVQCTGTTGASTLTLTLPSVAHGYADCGGRDVTNSTTVTQTGAVAQTTVTLTLTSVTQNDTIQFGCPIAY